MNIRQSLSKTAEQLKFDYDATNPRWFILTHIFNILYFYPNAQIAYSSSGKGFHIYVKNQPSNLDIRRLHREDKGRIWCTELRSRLLNVTENHDIIYRRKGTFRTIRNNGKIIIRWTKPPKGDSEPLGLQDILCLPFKLSVPQHVKRTMRYLKRKKGEKIEEAKHARAHGIR